MHVTVISPEGSVFEGEADSLVVPAYDGEVGILPRHAPFMTLLGEGRLVIREGEETTELIVAGGFLDVAYDRVKVVTEKASEPSA